MLLPALQNAKEKGKQAVCMSNMRQIHLIMMMYANDQNGWFPPTSTITYNAFLNNAPGPAWNPGPGWSPWDSRNPPTSWLGQYIKNQQILLCPSKDDRLQSSYTDTSNPVWIYGLTTYHILASTGDGGYAPFTFYGHVTAGGFDYSQSGTYRAPCPRLDFCGRTITGYSPGDEVGPIYIPPPDQVPALMDGFDPVFGGWSAWGYSSLPYADNNHKRLNGENIVFVDGHGEWRTAAKVQARFYLYIVSAYW